ncbi:5190_t:CDS:2 [Paraglomus brasilianum]|uniref:5190_t:CDS:1 n=1 Tax=Paraglomus brasilianum TaxID=144538 RepID=A0A9N9BP72_9GLOM|nr:5190_t:CDS:2 [Paraglomus brasilianum]
MAPPPPKNISKSKLTIDLSTIPSISNSPSGPLSPTYSGLSSPALSGSWVSSRSNAELTAALKDAYTKIKEKDRDLMLAAEIGKSLLDNNTLLKQHCEALVQEVKKLRKQTKGISSTMNTADKTSITRIPPPNGSTFEDDLLNFDDSDDADSVTSNLSEASDQILLSHPPMRMGMPHKEYEIIRQLELNNTELHAKLDNMVNEAQETDRLNKSKQRKLESEVEKLQAAYSQATQKIEDLEAEKAHMSQQYKTKFQELRNRKKPTDDEEDVQLLYKKIDELDEQNTILEKSKAETDSRLRRVLQDLDILRERCAHLEEISSDFDKLQGDYAEKQNEISGLRTMLETERIVGLGMKSATHTRTNSFTDATLGGRRLSDPDAMHAARIQKSTLLEELEDEWFRELAEFKRERKRSSNSIESPLFSPIASEADFREFYLRNRDLLDDDDKSAIDYLSDDEFSYVYPDYEEELEALRLKREWFWRRWARAVLNLVTWFWRWCRFLALLFAAVLLAVWRGPDELLSFDM